MRTRVAGRIVGAFAACVLAGCAGLGLSAGDLGPEIAGGIPSEASALAPQGPDAWPRQILLANAHVSVFPPQVESWQGNQLAFRCAVTSTPVAAGVEVSGMLWGTARAQVDRSSRTVSLEDFRLTYGNFPTLPDTGAAFLAQIQGQLPAALQTISLDRLAASLAATVDLAPARISVRNAPPVIFVSLAPAILIPIDGRPVWRRVPDTRFERVLNTRAAILREERSPRYFLHVYDGWLTAGMVNGPWTPATSRPDRIDEVASDLARKGELDLLAAGNVQPRPSLANGAPAIIVSQAPAELIVFKGRPNFEPIASTRLSWASNTTAEVIIDDSDAASFVLLAGRWFTAPSLAGPWSFISSANLPSDFKKIPPDSPAGLVLASVAGTPQAQAAAVENSLPQTATVSLVKPPTFDLRTDGPPQLAAIQGTPLQYVINSPTPTIRVDARAWYALRAGVWFVAPSVNGPWTVATLVPAAIHSIPASSPLHYVTYARIHGATADEVHLGYTPGYLGTLLAADGVVVYGTGFAYTPWIGAVYYAPPPTWGVMAQPTHDPAVGWSYGFALGLTTAAMLDSWGSPVAYSADDHGQPCCGSAGVNVYGVWGDTVTSGPPTGIPKFDGTRYFGGGGFGDRFGEGGGFGAGPGGGRR